MCFSPLRRKTSELVVPSTAGLDLRELLAPISRLSGFPKCGRATDIVYSSADASCLKKQNFMSDKKKKTFFHCFFVLVLKRAVLSLVPPLEKNPVKNSFPFFLSNK
jgi:hypothetical protein